MEKPPEDGPTEEEKEEGREEWKMMHKGRFNEKLFEVDWAYSQKNEIPLGRAIIIRENPRAAKILDREEEKSIQNAEKKLARDEAKGKRKR